MTPLLLVSSLALASTAFAAEPAQEVDTTLYYNGVKVAIDPVTGRLRQPTAAESAALKVSVATMPTQKSRGGKAMPKTRAEANRTVRKMRDGSVMMSVSEDMMSAVVATKQADGTIRVQHEGETQEANHE
ncbi:MAG: hypothetical protein WKG03_22915 [Telluria sp.]